MRNEEGGGRADRRRSKVSSRLVYDRREGHVFMQVGVL